MPSKTQSPSKPDQVPPSVEVDPNEPKLSKALLTRLAYVRAQRKELEQTARQFKAEEDKLVDASLAWMEERGIKTIKKFGFRITQLLGRAYPKWKEAFIDKCGAEAADQLQSEAPRSVSLQIDLED